MPLLEAQLETQAAAREAGAPTLAEVFGKSGGRHELTLFSVEEIAAVEAALSRKNGKLLVRCFATDKERPAKPEEIVRQLWTHRYLQSSGLTRRRLRFKLRFQQRHL